MKTKNLINLAMGGFISLFGGFNSAKAQELEKVDSLLNAKLENIEYISDAETYGINNFSHWQTLKETSERGAGNCSDKAIRVWDALDSMGIESQLVYGKHERLDTIPHMWVETDKYVLECSGKGKIYDKDSIRNLGNKYLHTNTKTKYITDKVIDYHNRTGKVLDIKGFEYLQKLIPLSTSPEFSSYFSDSTFLKTLPSSE